MKKWLLFLMLFQLTFTTAYAAPIQINVEPIHVEIKQKQTKKKQSHEDIIVIVEKKEDIAKLKKKYPDLHIRKTFNTLFQGFSAEADLQMLKKLKQSAYVTAASSQSTYHVSIDKSVPFIGGEAIRQIFGNKYGKLTGEGIKVGVIDTGMDYTHPDLKKSYHGGYDVVDEDNDPMETQATEEYPETLHGTHVAGIIAANGKVKGVAPNAELYAYRALGPGGMGTTEQVVAAIEKAVEDGMDIINLSLGNSVNGPDWITSIALNKAVEKGVVAVTSSGNSGPGMWTVGSPGTAAKAISVGASAPPLRLPFVRTSFGDRAFSIQPMQGSIPWEKDLLLHSYQLVAGGKGYLDQLQHVDGKIVLIERGEIEFTKKAKNAQQQGAKAVLIYNNEEGNFSGTLQEQINIPVYSLSQEDGNVLKDKIQKEKTWLKTEMKEVKDFIASFSSRGPVTHTWAVKPDITAPGIDIESTVPEGYMSLQGTSMAAPHIAGAAAILLEAHPNWTPKQVKAAMMNTAKLLINKEGETYKPSVQGAGRIQVKKAVDANTLIYPSSFTFGKINLEDGRQMKSVLLEVENVSDKEKSYSFEISEKQIGEQWKLPNPFSLSPGEKRKVRLTLDIQPLLMEHGIYESFVTVQTNGQSIHLPYLYVLEEANYPRVMGFEFSFDEEKENYELQFYLPEGAEEASVALFDPASLRYVGNLFQKRNVKRGTIKKVFAKDEIQIADGIYLAVISAKKAGREDTMAAHILIGEPPVFLRKKKG